jgi:hypothetical protein
MTQVYSTLFLGIPLTKELRLILDISQNQLYEHYLAEGFLSEIVIHGTTYIGKLSEDLVDLPQLVSMQDHINSLLKNVAPQFPFKENTLQLIPIRK